MLTLGAIGFAAPWFLLGLAALPLVWLLLRITPPQPVATRFPAIRFLFGLRQDDDSSERTPL
ncbi:MAG: BatA domain-containing protein, partial [Alphaproteobacteria bacterium]|nr:BatA domain-containing protein [Alphaproteobacteria bacterium]